MTSFNLDQSIEVLEWTPLVLDALLRDINVVWTSANEGKDKWSSYDVVGHLIHGEKTDWTTRINLTILEELKTDESFDRFAQIEESKGKSMNHQLLDEFAELRA